MIEKCLRDVSLFSGKIEIPDLVSFPRDLSWYLIFTDRKRILHTMVHLS